MLTGSWSRRVLRSAPKCEDLLQQVKNVKQLARFLSLRSEASRNEPAAPGERSTDSPPDAKANSGR